MNMILQIIKESYNTWKETTSIFWGENGFVYFFFLSMVIIFVFDKKTERKMTYIGYSAIVLLGLYNPITFYLCNYIFNGSYAYFSRLYSLLPVPFLIAYAVTFLLGKIKGLPKLILFFLIIGVIILGGTNIYNEDWIKKAENYSKFSNDVMEVCSAINGYNDHPCVAAPSELATSIRQLDGSIIMPYGREDIGGEDPLRIQLDSEYPDVDLTLKLAGDEACDFIILKKNDVNLYAFSEKRQELYGETDNYYIFRLENIPRIKRFFNDYCQVIECDYLDDEGNLYKSDNGYAAVKYDYDLKGNKCKEVFFDENMQPLLMSEGYNGVKYEYNKDRKVTKITYLDRDGNPIISSKGYASISYKYNIKGDIDSEYYYDESGIQFRLSLGYYGVLKRYDSYGRLISTIFVDENGIPIDSYVGYCEVRYEYDSLGRVEFERYYDNNGYRVESITGQAGLKKEYDENGCVINAIYIDTNDNPVMTNKRYASVKYIYDENRQKIKELYYNEKNELTPLSDGQYGIGYIYDDSGVVEGIYYLDESGETMTGISGISYIRREFDERGNIIAEYYYDEDDNPVKMSAGQYGYKKEYNHRNQVIEVTYLDYNKNPIRNESGYAIIKYNVDDYGNAIEERYYDEEGEPIALSSGEYGQKKEYDSNNLLSKIIFIDENGNPIETSRGYGIIKREYNDKRRLCAEFYFDTNGNPVESKSGYYGFLRESNLYDQELSITYLDKDNNPTEVGADKYSKVIWSYDGDSIIKNISYYNLKGEAVLSSDYQTWEVVQYSDEGGSQSSFYTLKNTVTGSLIVIDGGMPENTEQVRRVINDLGGTVDAWIITHFHADHASAYNNIQADPQGINIEKVYASAFDSDYEKYLEVARPWDNLDTFEMWMENSANNSNVYYPCRGETISIDNLQITFLNTYDDKLLELNGGSDLPNNCALVTLVEGNVDSMLFMSDMYSPKIGEYLMEEYGEKLKKVNYLQPSHHGNSIMPYDFYDFINPDVMFFDAPESLMEDDSLKAKELKEWCDEKGIKAYYYKTAPNRVFFN